MLSDPPVSPAVMPPALIPPAVNLPAVIPHRPILITGPFEAAPVSIQPDQPGSAADRAPAMITPPPVARLIWLDGRRGLRFSAQGRDGGGMAGYREVKRRMVTWFQRRIGNPVLVRMPGRTVLETTGRKSGEKRRTPIGGRVVGRDFWLVSEYGEQSQYVRNIKADPRVRVRIKGRWRAGIAYLMP